MYIQGSYRVFTVRGAWDIAQPFVCGKLKDVVEYALTLENGIDYFAEITNMGFKKISKKHLKDMLSYNEEDRQLKERLFKKY
jgi:hypothetical protein